MLGANKGAQEKNKIAKKSPYVTSVSKADWAIDVLKMPMNENTFLVAIVSGALDVVIWIQCNAGKDFSFSQLTYYHAAHNVYLDVLLWARSQDPQCPWDFFDKMYFSF